jgi:ABC-2 type transport system permease protein
MSAVIRNFKLYFLFMSQQLKAILEYQSDFVITVIATMLTQLSGFLFLALLYNRIPEINGWLFWEVAFIYAMIYFTEGFISLFFNGIWRISQLVNSGEFDRYLIRPVSPILQILSSAVGMNGFGNLFIGFIIIFQCFYHLDINWSVSKVLMCIVILFSAIAIRLSIYFAACSFSFWTHSPGNAFATMTHNISDFAKYPISIYSFGVKALITAVIPYAFISFFPAAYIFDKPNGLIMGALTPLVAVYSILVSVWIFKRGIMKYESTGN